MPLGQRRRSPFLTTLFETVDQDEPQQQQEAPPPQERTPARRRSRFMDTLLDTYESPDEAIATDERAEQGIVSRAIEAVRAQFGSADHGQGDVAPEFEPEAIASREAIAGRFDVMGALRDVAGATPAQRLKTAAKGLTMIPGVPGAGPRAFEAVTGVDPDQIVEGTERAVAAGGEVLSDKGQIAKAGARALQNLPIIGSQGIEEAGGRLAAGIAKEWAGDVYQTLTNPAQAIRERQLLVLLDLIDVGVLGAFGVQVARRAGAKAAIEKFIRSHPKERQPVIRQQVQQIRREAAEGAVRSVSDERVAAGGSSLLTPETPEAAMVAKAMRRKFGDDVPEAVVERADEIAPGAREALEEAAEAPRFEDTFVDTGRGVVQGEQGVIPGAPRRSVPDKPIEAPEHPTTGLFDPELGRKQPKQGTLDEPSQMADVAARRGQTDEVPDVARRILGDETPATTADDLMHRLQADATESGGLARGTEHYRQMIRQLPDDELAKFKTMVEGPDAPPFVQRFIGKEVSGEIRGRPTVVTEAAPPTPAPQGLLERPILNRLAHRSFIGRGKTTPLDRKLQAAGYVDEANKLSQQGEKALTRGLKSRLEEMRLEPDIRDEIVSMLDEARYAEGAPVERGGSDEILDAVMTRGVKIDVADLAGEYQRIVDARPILRSKIKRYDSSKGGVGAARGVPGIDDLADEFGVGVNDVLEALEYSGKFRGEARLDAVRDFLRDYGSVKGFDLGALLVDAGDARALTTAAIRGNSRAFRELKQIAKVRAQLRGQGITALEDEGIDVFLAGLHLGIMPKSYDRAVQAFYQAVERLGDNAVIRGIVDASVGALGAGRGFGSHTVSGRHLVQRLFDPRYGQPEEFKKLAINRMRRMSGWEAVAAEQAARLSKGFSTAERVRLGQIMKAADPRNPDLRMDAVFGGGKLADPQLVDLHARAREAADIFADLGRQAVGVGLLREETFFRTLGTYMPRLYAANEYNALMRQFGINRKSRKWRQGLSRFKRRKDSYGVVYIRGARAEKGTRASVDQPTLLEPPRRAEPPPTAGPPVTAKNMAEARRRLAAQQGARRGQQAIGEESFPAGTKEMKFKTEGARDKFIDKVGPDNVLQVWEPVPLDLRLEMGEIVEPAYPTMKGIVQLSADIETAKVFRAVADNPEWTFKPLDNQGMSVPEGFVQVLESPTPRAFDPIGPLRGNYVLESIADDINMVNQVRSSSHQTVRALMRMWKFNKVVMNPATHSRNIMSNAILADLGGFSLPQQPWYLWKSLGDLYAASQGKRTYSRFYREARDGGLLGTTLTKHELELIGDAWARSYGDTQIPRLVTYAENIGQKTGIKKLGALYQAEEQWFKLAAFRWARTKKGMSVDEAIDFAEKHLFNYGDVPLVVEVLRDSPTGLPFLTFTTKAIPRYIEAALDNPLRVMKYAALFEGVEAVARRQFNQSPERARISNELMPEWLANSSNPLGRLLSLRQTVRTPFTAPGPDDRQLGVGIGFILPWGELVGQGPLGAIGDKFAGPFWGAVFAAIGKDPFLGRDIWTSEMTATDQAAAIISYLYQYNLPALTPPPSFFGGPRSMGTQELRGGASAERLRSAWFNELEEEDGYERNPSLGLTALDVLGGIRMRPINDERNRMFLILEQKGILDHYRRRLYSIYADPNLSDDEQTKRAEAATRWLEEAADEIGRLEDLNLRR